MSGATRARNRHDIRTAGLGQFGGQRLDQFVVEHVDLVERHDHGLVDQPCAVSLQFVTHDAIALADICVVRIDQVQQHTAPFDMSQEPVANPRTVRRALDQAGNIGDHKFLALMADHAQLRTRGGKGISSDLGLCVRDGIDERRFARIGQPDQSDIGKQLKPQPDPFFLARPAHAVLARRAVGCGLVACIAAPAIAAAQEHALLTLFGEVREDMLLVLAQHLGADGHVDDQILPARAGHVRACTAFPARRPEMLRVAKVDQRIEAVHRAKHDVPALAAIAAIGAAIFDELFAAECDGAGSTGTRRHINFCLVEEMHGEAY